MQALSPVLDSLIGSFDPAPFRNTRDQARLEDVVKALTQTLWRAHFEFVLWFAGWLGGIMGWIGGCDCCAYTQGAAPSKCPQKGRRLNGASAFVSAEHMRGLNEATGWGRESVAFDVPFASLAALQSCVRATLAFQKVSYLDRLPYLLVRLDTLGIRDECLRQWNACAPEKHHRISRHFLEPRGCLRNSIDAFDDKGGNFSAMLRAEISGLEAVPMDDAIAEGPHAQAKQIKYRSKAASFAWISASMRLRQNVGDLELMPTAVKSTLRVEWAKHKSILQVDKRKLNQNAKMSNPKFLNKVYRIGGFRGQTVAVAQASVVDVEDITSAGGGAAGSSAPPAMTPQPCTHIARGGSGAELPHCTPAMTRWSCC